LSHIWRGKVFAVDKDVTVRVWLRFQVGLGLILRFFKSPVEIARIVVPRIETPPTAGSSFAPLGCAVFGGAIVRFKDFLCRNTAAAQRDDTGDQEPARRGDSTAG
jgi:hypothetical protein